MDNERKDKFIIDLPEFCLVAMVGATSSGKTVFANRHFKPTEVLSSDFFRAMVCDDETSQDVSADAFDLLFKAAEKRLKNMKLTVIDATNIQQSARKQILELAKAQNVHAAAIVLNLPEEIIMERNKARPERNFSERVIKGHCRDVKRCIKNLKREGFRFVYVINSVGQLEDTEIVRSRLWNNKKDEHGPFDIIGDVHGCCDELAMLFDKLGYIYDNEKGYFSPDGRKAVFVGDLCDRGPKNAEVLEIVMKMTAAGNAYAVPGNHDVKLLKYLRGKKVAVTHGFDRTIGDIESRGAEFKEKTAAFIDGLISHYVFDDGKLVVSHAGLRQEYIGRGSARVREFCLYGETTGETDEYGLPVRLDWAADYRGRAAIVYGHIASKEVRVLNGTYCIDTGCVFGGKLTAYRYPERETVSVDALTEYYAPIKPLGDNIDNSIGDMLTADDFRRKLHITTELVPSVDIDENNAAAALEIMSRFAADPHWLIYLPPTMSPCKTSKLDDYLEHPLQAFEYYRENGVQNVICEKKHMGSRAVIVICRDAQTAAERFGINDGTLGIIYTRTGRRFFDIKDIETEKEILDRLNSVFEKTGFYEDFNTGWVCLDTELMPWSEKAKSLIMTQYAPSGRAAADGTKAAETLLKAAAERNTADNGGITAAELLEKYSRKRDAAERYIKAYEEYCYDVGKTDDFRIAPFHILACENNVFNEKSHIWHMETIRKYIAGNDIIFIGTPYITVNTEDDDSINNAVGWWTELTAGGGEGMVVKPEIFTSFKRNMLLQPAVKCRGREYLRIIYGAEYLFPEHLERLKNRSLSRKRSLAVKEFSLGVESLKRFVKYEPLYRVHECSFGVLALESEPVDPRL